MPDQFGRPGRRADLARLLHATLIEHGTAPLDGAAGTMIDEKVEQVASELGISEAAALKQLDDHLVIALATNTAHNWHAAHLADEAAGELAVPVPAADTAQPVMGLAMAVGQIVREAYGDLPAADGEPLDALCKLASPRNCLPRRTRRPAPAVAAAARADWSRPPSLADRPAARASLLATGPVGSSGRPGAGAHAAELQILAPLQRKTAGQRPFPWVSGGRPLA
jgi:hypothetical protein